MNFPSAVHIAFRKHYGKTCSNQEISEEIAALKRKHEQGLLDDNSEKIWARLRCLGAL
jgi:hypothetical protein